MNTTDNSGFLSALFSLPVKPDLFEPGESLFWNDPHISKSMLDAHLEPDTDGASRKHETIDKEVQYLLSSGFVKPGDKVLDLGCGPGLYSCRFAARGVQVTGIDISQNSLDYARRYAAKKNLDIDYRLMNFFDMDYAGEFDVVLQVNGELNTFSDIKRDELLARLRKALKPGGYLIFDITTRAARTKSESGNYWFISSSGFWRSHDHLVLTRNYDYPEDNVWLDQFIVVDSDESKVYNNWFHDYDLATIHGVMHDAGFTVVETWNDLAGSRYSGDGEWIALVAKKNA